MGRSLLFPVGLRDVVAFSTHGNERYISGWVKSAPPDTTMIKSRHHNRIKRLAVIFLVIGSLLITFRSVSAHEGPPYPIMVDKMIGPCLVSVWADPDVGIGTYF